MISAFAAEFFWKSLRDFRAWIGVAGLALAAIGGVTGRSTILPTWFWLFVAFASAISMAIRAEWKAYRDEKAKIEPDMKLVDVVKRIVGSDDILVGENCSKTGSALLTIRESGHLGKIAVWGRRDVLTEDMDLYPRTPIPAEYWDEFGIDYLRFTDDQKGESRRVRGQPGQSVYPTQPRPQFTSFRYRMFTTATFGIPLVKSKRIGRSPNDGSSCNGLLNRPAQSRGKIVGSVVRHGPAGRTTKRPQRCVRCGLLIPRPDQKRR